MTTKLTWTSDRLETLKSMWLAGSTSSTIGEALGVSRNTVMGKITRLRLTRRPFSRERTRIAEPKPVPVKPKRKARPAMPSKKGMNRAEVILRNADFLKRVEPVEETVLDIRCRNVTLMDLTLRGMCRWPFGDVRAGGVTYCGNDCDEKDSYCGPHKALAYRPAVSA